eukprot:766852-Hanusia_phi.AAC.4
MGVLLFWHKLCSRTHGGVGLAAYGDHWASKVGGRVVPGGAGRGGRWVVMEGTGGGVGVVIYSSEGGWWGWEVARCRVRLGGLRDAGLGVPTG